jgi:hypothetical protein
MGLNKKQRQILVKSFAVIALAVMILSSIAGALLSIY